MKLDFNYIDYLALYNYNLYQKNTLEENYKCVRKFKGGLEYEKNTRHEICFSSLFSNIREDNYYKVNADICIYYDDTTVLNRKNNFCILSKDKVIWYLRYLKNTVSYKFEFIESTDSYWVINLKMKDVKRGEIKWLFTWIRFLYEHPFSLPLTHAVLLKMNNKTPKINLYNLYNILQIRYNVYFNSGHCLVKNDEYIESLKIKDIKSRLQTLNSVNNIYQVKECKDIKKKISPKLMMKDCMSFDTDYIQEEKELLKCISFIKEIKKYIKTNKSKIK